MGSGGGGGKINQPKRASVRRRTRQKKRQGRKPHVRSEETLADTTLSKLRQCRSNPKANVRLSGKKRRLVSREFKRLLEEKVQMEVVEMTNSSQPPVQRLTKATGTEATPTMDTT